MPPPVLRRPRRNVKKLPAADVRLYDDVAGRISALIDAGTLRVGERVPSVRKLSRQLGVSVGTVLHAYQLLEDASRIEARPQSGYYVRPRAAPLPEPAATRPPARASTPSVGDLVLRMVQMSNARGFVPLGGATPNPEWLPTKQLNRTSAAVARRTSRGFNHYDVPPGCPELRVQVAKHYLEAGCALSPDDLVTTCGCQEAISLCLRAVARPGDVVAVESPAYYGQLQTIEMLGLRALELPTDPREGVSVAALKYVLGQQRVAACVLVPTVQNPLGCTVPEERKRGIVALLAAHGVPLIEDDIYGDLDFSPQRAKVCKAFDKEGNVLLCGSFSKTLAPGARVGWCAPGRFLDAVQRLKLCTTLATPTLPQLAIAEFLATGGYARHLRKLRRLYADQLRHVSAAVQHHFPPGTRATRPAGGHLLWVEMPPQVDALDLFERAAAKGICVAPGPMFSSTGKYRNFVRLNCSVPRTAEIDRAIEALGAMARELAGAAR